MSRKQFLTASCRHGKAFFIVAFEAATVGHIKALQLYESWGYKISLAEKPPGMEPCSCTVGPAMLTMEEAAAVNTFLNLVHYPTNMDMENQVNITIPANVLLDVRDIITETLERFILEKAPSRNRSAWVSGAAQKALAEIAGILQNEKLD